MPSPGSQVGAVRRRAARSLGESGRSFALGNSTSRTFETRPDRLEATSHRGGHWFDPSIAHQARGYADLSQITLGSHSFSQRSASRYAAGHGGPRRAGAGGAETASTSITRERSCWPGTEGGQHPSGKSGSPDASAGPIPPQHPRRGRVLHLAAVQLPQPPSAAMTPDRAGLGRTARLTPRTPSRPRTPRSAASETRSASSWAASATSKSTSPPTPLRESTRRTGRSAWRTASSPPTISSSPSGSRPPARTTASSTPASPASKPTSPNPSSLANVRPRSRPDQR